MLLVHLIGTHCVCKQLAGICNASALSAVTAFNNCWSFAERDTVTMQTCANIAHALRTDLCLLTVQLKCVFVMRFSKTSINFITISATDFYYYYRFLFTCCLPVAHGDAKCD